MSWETRNVFKKDKRRQIKKGRQHNTRLSTFVLVHKSFTDNRKLKMNIVKWTAILANFVRGKWCLQIPLRRFITCVMTNRGKKTCNSYLVHIAHAQANNIKWEFTSGDVIHFIHKIFCFTRNCILFQYKKHFRKQYPKKLIYERSKIL